MRLITAIVGGSFRDSLAETSVKEAILIGGHPMSSFRENDRVKQPYTRFEGLFWINPVIWAITKVPVDRVSLR